VTVVAQFTLTVQFLLNQKSGFGNPGQKSRVINMSRKSGSEIRKSGSEIRVGNPGHNMSRKSGLENRVGNPGVRNPGRKSGSEIQVGNLGEKSG
jgi:hypothetical protein